MISRRTRTIACFLFPFALGLAAGWALFVLLQPSQEREPTRELHAGHSGLLNPLIDLRSPEAPSEELHSFQDELTALVGSLEGECPGQQIAVYFRDLDNGPWMGVKQGRRFLPASLIKVPIVMAALKQSDLAPGFLQQKVAAPLAFPPGAGLSGFDTLEPGKTYTVGELVEAAAVESSNDATWLLLETVAPEVLRSTLDLLGLQSDTGQILDIQYSLAPRDYGAFFRVLYNATYLQPETSQFALELFTRSPFKDGLVAGVPEGVLVAHKFGLRPIRQPGEPERWSLHDAGIVYHPGRPYLLCVMTLGCDQASLKRYIATISRLVWTKVEESLPPPER